MKAEKITRWFGLCWTALRSSNVGPTFLLVLLLLFVAIAVPLLWHLIASIWTIPQIPDLTDRTEAVRNLGLIVAALVGIPFVIWRTSVAQKQVEVSEQGQITDRINKAVEGLGAERTVKILDETPRFMRHNDEWLVDDENNPIPATRPDGKAIIDRKTFEQTAPNLEVRIGSIFALEKIARDVPQYHLQIMEILCAYVRANARCRSVSPSTSMIKMPTVRSDIQTVINVIGRRSQLQVEIESDQLFRLDLRNTLLSGIDFRKGDFSAAMFHDCQIEAANFSNCKLHGTQFFRSSLNYTDFFSADMTGSRLDLATINAPEVPAGGMSESITMASIRGMSLAGSDISGINYLGEPAKTNTTFGTSDTKLHHDLDFDRRKFDSLKRTIRQLEQEKKLAEAFEERQRLEQFDFTYWSPHPHSDGITGHRRAELLTNLNLNGWPYI